METYRCKYEYSRRHGNPFHVWSLIGAHGGLHLHIGEFAEDSGIEVHYRTPPDYMENQPPSDDHCWLLKTPCWHDGSSLQATEVWIPLWKSLNGDHDAMFDALRQEAAQRFDQNEP